MSQSHYWEAQGLLRAQIREVLLKRAAALERITEFIQHHGGYGYGGYEHGHLRFDVAFKEPPDLAVWRRIQGTNDHYAPRKNTKAGKALATHIEALGKEVVGGTDIAKLVGYAVYHGSGWRTPGVYAASCTERIVLVLDTDYVPTAEVAKQLTRISDVEFEAMKAEDGKPKDRKPKKPKPKKAKSQ